MELPKNLFKARLKAGTHQLGIWNTLGGNTVPELLALAGFDWVLVDCEHSAVEVVDVLPAMQAIAGYPSVAPVVRPASNDPVLIKRVLDLGAQTLMIPFVNSAAEAQAAVDAMRYAPKGIRGMAGMTRATRYGAIKNYPTKAEDELCLIVQIETAEAVDALDDIASVDGVDAVFVGPADLSASLGYPGNSAHPEVQRVMADIFARLKDLGVPSGLLSLDPKDAAARIAAGTSFTAVGVDQVVLVSALRALRQQFD